MFDLEFRDPWFLALTLLAPLVWYAAARVPSTLAFPTLEAAESAPRSLRARLAGLPAVLFAAAAALTVAALAGPRTGDATTYVREEGIAIVMALDRSGSMAAVDFTRDKKSISRLDAVKAVFRSFVAGGSAGAGRAHDLVGLVAFGTYADGLCPLTLDHANLLQIVEDTGIPPERGEQSTAIGEGLALAVERLRAVDAASKVVILLTDGVSNAGELQPLEAAELAAANGVRVYTIGVGTTGYAPIPVRGADGRERLQRVRVEIDEDTLREIATRTGGRYFHARDAEGLEGVYREIDRLERSEITEVRYLQYREHYAWPAGAALALLLLGAASRATVLRRLP